MESFCTSNYIVSANAVIANNIYKSDNQNVELHTNASSV